MENNTILEQTRLNLQDFLKLLIFYRKIIYLIVGLTVVSLIVYTLLVSPLYKAEAKILPTTSTPPSFNIFKGLLGGFDLGRMEEGEYISSYFFPKVLTSRTLLEKLLETEFEFTHKSEKFRLRLEEYYKTDIIDLDLMDLEKRISVDTDIETGIITIRYESHYPELSAQVINKLIEYLNWYNNVMLKTKATENLNYIDARLDIVTKELQESEEKVKEFKEQNRNYQVSSSPEQQLLLERLEREKAVKSDIYQTLINQREIERLKAQREIPVVNVLHYASPPYLKSFPQRKLIVIGGFLVSMAFSILLILLIYLVSDDDSFKSISLSRMFSYFVNDLRNLNPFKK